MDFQMGPYRMHQDVAMLCNVEGVSAGSVEQGYRSPIHESVFYHEKWWPIDTHYQYAGEAHSTRKRLSLL